MFCEEKATAKKKKKNLKTNAKSKNICYIFAKL